MRLLGSTHIIYFKGSVVQQRVRQDSVIFSQARLRRARLKMQAFAILRVWVD